ncbi:uncharacterized protein M6B38_314175 [Iris pallida]|uniref:Uncharacterized protein n=1 Tax=Iris pallida TaxID=29817 RepID=A0AAX6HF36_IRIPA|nr:uncharacterized protein M6B38_314175 [Iris pallida]
MLRGSYVLLIIYCERLYVNFMVTLQMHGPTFCYVGLFTVMKGVIVSCWKMCLKMI